MKKAVLYEVTLKELITLINTREDLIINLIIREEAETGGKNTTGKK